MATRKSSSRSAPAQRDSTARRAGADSARVSRLAPASVMRVAVAPHVRTMSNGQPRPKRRSK